MNNYFGCNFKRLINSYRVVRAKELLDGKDCPVNELFSRCGFASKSVFYVAFRKVVGMTPLQYISQSRNPFMIQRNLSPFITIKHFLSFKFINLKFFY